MRTPTCIGACLCLLATACSRVSSSNVGDDGGSAGAGASGGGAGASGGAAGASGGAAGASGGTGMAGVGGTDTTPPTILSTEPADQAAGVASNASIVITFSEAMDQASVEAAYQSADLPASQAAMTWNATGSVLTIQPTSILVYATGTDPATTVAKSYAYVVTTNARDLAGNPMAQNASVQFSTLRDITQTLNANDLGYVAGNGGYNIGVMEAGDSAIDKAIRGFATFSLAPVASGIGTGWDKATLTLHQGQVSGTPYSTLGALQCDSLEYASLNLTAFNALDDGYDLPISASGANKVLNVLTPMTDSIYGKRSNAQFRVAFTVDTNNDGKFEWVNFDSAVLSLHYFAP